jgi:hypothetical protein
MLSGRLFNDSSYGKSSNFSFGEVHHFEKIIVALRMIWLALHTYAGAAALTVLHPLWMLMAPHGTTLQHATTILRAG